MLILVLPLWASAVFAQDNGRLALLLDRLWVLGQMDDNIRSTHDAFLVQTDVMDAQLLGGHGGTGFRKALKMIFAPDVLHRTSRHALALSMTGHEAALESYLAFLETQCGPPWQRAVEAGGPRD
ncbi:MAG: hypothetical protein ABI832_20115 [bacterium]